MFKTNKNKPQHCIKNTIKKNHVLCLNKAHKTVPIKEIKLLYKTILYRPDYMIYFPFAFIIIILKKKYKQ